MPIEPSFSSVLKGFDIGTKIANFLSIMKSTEAKLDKLIQVELKAGASHLLNAVKIVSDLEQKELVREARNCFQKAVYLEKGSKNEAIALIGLACCYHWLGEEKAGNTCLDQILQINPITPARVAFYKFHVYKGIYNDSSISRGHKIVQFFLSPLALLLFLYMPTKLF